MTLMAKKTTRPDRIGDRTNDRTYGMQKTLCICESNECIVVVQEAGLQFSQLHRCAG